MSQTNNTPGLFEITNKSGTTATIVLDAVSCSEYTNGLLEIALPHGTVKLDQPDDIERFGVEFNRHHAAKVAFISSEALAEVRCSATCCGDVMHASAPGASAEAVGDQMHVEGKSSEHMLGLLQAIGMMKAMHADDLPEPQVHIHRVELAGVDMNDMAAVRKAVEMTAAAIKLINGEDQAPAEPTEHVLPTRFMQMGILTDYCLPIREAIDAGFDLAKIGTKKPGAFPGKGTLRDMLINLGWHLYHAEVLMSKPAEPARGNWGAPLPSAEMIELQAKYDRACLERAEAEANLEAADKQLKVYNLRTAEMQASVTGMVDELYNLAHPPKRGTPKMKAPLQPDDTF